MHPLFKRVLTTLLATVMIFGLTSCTSGGAPSEAGSATEGTSEVSEAAPAASQESSDAGTGAAVTLNGIATTDWQETVVKNIYAAMESDFTPDNPDITVSFEHVPFAELDKKIITSHVGGVYYDIIQTNHPSVGVFADSGIIEPLDSYFESSDIDLAQYNESFLESASYKGTRYALPFETDCRVLAVNEELLKAEGLELPKTKEDMLAIAEKVTKDTDGDGKNDQYGIVYHFTNVWFPTYDLGQWILGNGTSIFKEDGDKYTACFDTPEMKDFMDWAIQMIPYQPTDFISYDGTQITSLFADGKVAMYVAGPWVFADPIFVDKGWSYTTIINPTGSVKSGSSMGGWHWGMGSMSEHKDEVWRVFDFLSRPEISARTVASLPPRFDAYDHAPYNDEKFGIFKQQLETASLPAPAIPELTEIAELWNKQFQAAMLGEKSIDDALATAQTDVQAVLDKRGE